MNRRLAALGLTSVLLPTGLAAAPAQAAGTCTLSVPARIGITSPFKEVPVRVNGGCIGGFGFWSAIHATQGPQASIMYPGDTSFDLYDFDTLGVWKWRAEGAWNSNGDDVPQNAPISDIRTGSRAFLTLSRSGSTVTATTTTTRYHPTYGTYRGFAPSTPATLQRKTSTGSWVNIKTLAPTSVGRYTTRFTAKSAATYRVVVPANTRQQIWASASVARTK